MYLHALRLSSPRGFRIIRSNICLLLVHPRVSNDRRLSLVISPVPVGR